MNAIKMCVLFGMVALSGCATAPTDVAKSEGKFDSYIIVYGDGLNSAESQKVKTKAPGSVAPLCGFPKSPVTEQAEFAAQDVITSLIGIFAKSIFTIFLEDQEAKLVRELEAYKHAESFSIHADPKKIDCIEIARDFIAKKNERKTVFRSIYKVRPVTTSSSDSLSFQLIPIYNGIPAEAVSDLDDVKAVSVAQASGSKFSWVQSVSVHSFGPSGFVSASVDSPEMLSSGSFEYNPDKFGYCAKENNEICDKLKAEMPTKKNEANKLIQEEMAADGETGQKTTDSSTTINPYYDKVLFTVMKTGDDVGPVTFKFNWVEVGDDENKSRKRYWLRLLKNSKGDLSSTFSEAIVGLIDDDD